MPHYIAAFRAEAVRFARTSGESLSEIARDLGIDVSTLGKFVAAHLPVCAVKTNFCTRCSMIPATSHKERYRTRVVHNLRHLAKAFSFSLQDLQQEAEISVS